MLKHLKLPALLITLATSTTECSPFGPQCDTDFNSRPENIQVHNTFGQPIRLYLEADSDYHSAELEPGASYSYFSPGWQTHPDCVYTMIQIQTPSGNYWVTSNNVIRP